MEKLTISGSVCDGDGFILILFQDEDDLLSRPAALLSFFQNDIFVASRLDQRLSTIAAQPLPALSADKICFARSNSCHGDNPLSLAD